MLRIHTAVSRSASCRSSYSLGPSVGPHLNTRADSELCPTAALCQSLPVDVCWFLIGTDSCILRDRNITSVKNSTFCLSANAVGNLTKLINLTVDGNKTYVSPSEEYFK